MAALNKVPDKNFILKNLYGGIVNLTFTKKDGELREMNATLMTRMMDPRKIKESSPNPPGSDSNQIVCWDIDKNDWRSFKIDTITEYNGVVRKA